MKYQKILFFAAAVAISLIAAHYRFGDSGHAIGSISGNGGNARHPTSLESGSDMYTLIATATVLPPFKGDARVVLEGRPAVEHDIYLTTPVIDLGIHDFPEFRENTLYGLKPGERIAMWVVMKPPRLDPVCGMKREEGFLSLKHKGREYFFCGESCLEQFRAQPQKYEKKDSVRGKYTLAFYDTRTGKAILQVPLLFSGKEDGHGTAPHH